ncbi:MAG: acyl-CoA dehydrogenase [Pseudomonadota bacterium]|nr:acyl-CoA dehydrogenase [Pseudomonadota bacterium]
MPNYKAPVEDLGFVLSELIDIEQIVGMPGYEDASADLIEAVLAAAGKFASEVLAPLNRAGDQQAPALSAGVVTTLEGWKDAYQQFTEGGWTSLIFDPDFGGQGLPRVVGTAVQEMWDASNMSFGLCPLLTQSASEAIWQCGSDEQKRVYLPKLVSGEWAGTMNLTEPQAGSDLSAVRTRADPTAAGHYLINGQKIFITYGEHDLTANIIHLVLARTPDAPEGVGGISLFLVPKFIPDEHGEPGERNDLCCVSLEHKLGIHGSPTAVMSYGDNGGATGYLVGEENRGLEYMFIMMNMARHAVGIEGYAIAERAYQRALNFARERIQGRAVGGTRGERVSIIAHPDVARMLLDMKSRIEAMRAVSLYTAAAMDRSLRHPDEAERARGKRSVEVLIPIVKGWSSEVGNWVTSSALQVHGGMGFIEETGAAQHYRDARITTIYEGTTGIQAADLVGRKLVRDGGQMATELIEQMDTEIAQIIERSDDPVSQISAAVLDSLKLLSSATAWILESAGRDPRLPYAASFQYLMLWGAVAGGWQMTKAAAAATACLEDGRGDPDFYRSKLLSCRHYAEHVLPEAEGYYRAVVSGSTAVLDAAAGAL